MNHYNSRLEEGTQSRGGVSPSLFKGRACAELDSVWIHMKCEVGRVKKQTNNIVIPVPMKLVTSLTG